MNKRALSTLIYLTWAVLLCSVIVKIFFPEWFAILITNDKIIAVGRYIDGNVLLLEFCKFISGFLVYNLYLCACCKKWVLKWWQYITLFFILTIMSIISYFVSYAGIIIDTVLMVSLPCIMKAEYKTATFIFSIHSIGQLALLFIRIKPLALVSVDFATQFIMCIDVYIWLLLYYLYANKYKEDNLWEELRHRFLATKAKLKSSRKSKD